jgi:hypothetical protein
VNYQNYQDALGIIKEFYERAWGQLIVLVSIITGALAVLPIILTVINFVKAEKTLKETKKEIDAYSKKLKSIEIKYSETFKIMEQKNNGAMGGVLFTQGNLHLNEDTEEAFFSFLRALDYFTMANNENYVEKSIAMVMDIYSTTDGKIKPSNEYFELLNHVISWMNEDIRKCKYAEDINFLNELKVCRNKEKEGI